MASLPEHCCTIPPLKSDYTPIGDRLHLKVDQQNDLEVYSTGPANSRIALVGIYDICGVHPNTLQGADHLAKTSGFHVVIPDFFRGPGWPPDNIPPKEGRAALNAWIHKVGAWEVLGPALLAVCEHLRANGATAIGVSNPSLIRFNKLHLAEDSFMKAYGLCFGAKKLMQGAHEKLFESMALIHPSLIQAEDADNVTAPVALLPSQGEDKEAMNAFWSRIQAKENIAKKSIRQDFLDVHHGFASARSNWADERLANRAREAYGTIHKFFCNTLVATREECTV